MSRREEQLTRSRRSYPTFRADCASEDISREDSEAGGGYKERRRAVCSFLWSLSGDVWSRLAVDRRVLLEARSSEKEVALISQ